MMFNSDIIPRRPTYDPPSGKHVEGGGTPHGSLLDLFTLIHGYLYGFYLTLHVI